MDFGRDNVDMAIRYGLGRYPGLRVDPLMKDTNFPVCSPALLAGPVPLSEPGDLRRHSLLHDAVGPFESPDWSKWLAAVGVTGAWPDRGQRYSQSRLVLQAAIDGQGVALGRSTLVALDLEAGRLVQPFGPALPSIYACYVVSPPATAERPKIKAFRDWLLDEAGAT